LPGGFLSALTSPPAPPSARAWQQTCFDQKREPTGGGYLAFAYGKPQAAKFSLIPNLSLSKTTSNFIQAPCYACWMVRVGGNGQSVPLPVTEFGALPKPAGRSRAEPHGPIWAVRQTVTGSGMYLPPFGVLLSRCRAACKGSSF